METGKIAGRFGRNGRNAGEGPRPNLISQGLNSAEAPGGQRPAMAAAPSPAPAPRPAPAPGAGPRPMGRGGRYDANAHLDEYRRIARDYGLKS